MSVSTTSAASKVSPERMFFSLTRPVSRLRYLTRLKAWPLPGLTKSFSMMLQGSPSTMILTPGRNWLVLMVAITLSWERADAQPSARRGWERCAAASLRAASAGG